MQIYAGRSEFPAVDLARESVNESNSLSAQAKRSRPRFGVSGSYNHPESVRKDVAFQEVIGSDPLPLCCYQQFSGYSIGVPSGDPAVSIHERMNRPSNLYELGASEEVVQRVLRHAKPDVTRERYIKAFDPVVLAAMKSLEATLNTLNQ